jgi:hypothetical protein
MILRSWKTQAPRRGIVVVLVTVCLVILMAALAYSLDGGTLLAEYQHAQATADAAACAAATDLYDKWWTNNGADLNGTAVASGLRTAADNGYTNDGVNSKVTINIPPKAGAWPYQVVQHIGQVGYAEVIVEYYQKRSFSNIFSSAPIPVRARAVAFGSAIALNVGILVLDPSVKGALTTQGTGTTDVGTVPVIVNSTNDQAAIAGGGGMLKAPEFDITGNYGTNGSGTFVGDMKTNVPPTPDPLADLPPPDKSTMVVQSKKQFHKTSGSWTLYPGVYVGGISASGTASLLLMPGIYYMDGGGFQFTGQGSLYGVGVMIYNDPGNGNSGGVSVSGQGSIIMKPPTDGPYQGILFFQNRTATVSADIQGAGGQTQIDGTFYFANALLKVMGNAGVSNLGSQYISRTLQLGGNGDIKISWNPQMVARTRTIGLVE